MLSAKRIPENSIPTVAAMGFCPVLGSGASGTSPSSITYRPVSYTHLDVYKRQVQRHLSSRKCRPDHRGRDLSAGRRKRRRKPRIHALAGPYGRERARLGDLERRPGTCLLYTSLAEANTKGQSSCSSDASRSMKSSKISSITSMGRASGRSILLMQTLSLIHI